MNDLDLAHRSVHQLSGITHQLANQYLLAARETLVRLMRTPGLTEAMKLSRRPGFYTRNLLFGDDRMSVWALVWSPGSHTPIHDHHCSCCFGILTGSIREISFKSRGGTCAIKIGETNRQAGYIASMIPTGPNIHQMINDGAEDAISLHIYGYDHRMHGSSVHREYRQVDS